MDNFPLTGTYTDMYQLSMAQVYYRTGTSHHQATFDYFFRRLPFEGGYCVFAGLADLLHKLENLRFTTHDADYLKSIGLDRDFADHLLSFRFTGDIYAAREGEIVFPNEPVLRVDGSMLEAQVIETLLLNLLNFQSLVATKAARMRYVAGSRLLADFGLRRAQALGGYHATRAAIIGGFDATSNVVAGADFGIPVVGTMAHAFVQSYDDELTAFRDFATHRPNQCVLLVDTYDTLKSGVPNAITVANEMKQRGQALQGIRLDSGDLAYLSKHARRMLDEAGHHDVKITASNQLDEWVIKSLIDQQSPIDVFGVGTSLVTAPPDAALDGVYKLAYAAGKPRIKLSENLKKITLPDKKQVYRVLNDDGTFYSADVICHHHETNPAVMHHPADPDKSLSIAGRQLEPLLQPVMQKGKALAADLPLKDIAQYSAGRLLRLAAEHKRFNNPHTYKVGLSERLRDERDRLKKQRKP